MVSSLEVDERNSQLQKVQLDMIVVDIERLADYGAWWKLLVRKFSTIPIPASFFWFRPGGRGILVWELLFVWMNW